MIKKYIRSDLQNFHPYHSSPVSYEMKLDANESPFGLSEQAKKNIIEWLLHDEDLNRYPDTDCTELRQELAKYWDVEEKNVICGVGSDQLIDCMMKVLLEPGDSVVMPSPSFSMYKLTVMLNHGTPIEVDLGEDYAYNIDKIIEVCREKQPKMLILCSPNNPTGNCLENKDIIKIAKIVKCPILIDEAYGEFAQETMIDYIEEYPHIIVMRTFSKAFGLAGLRIGYGIGSKEIIEAIYVTKPPYNVNTLSQKIAVEVLKDSLVYKERIHYLQNEQEWLFAQLKKISQIKTYGSSANFILIQSGDAKLTQKLNQQGIFVRGFSKEKGLENCIRITVGNREQNEKLIKVLKQILQ